MGPFRIVYYIISLHICPPSKRFIRTITEHVLFFLPLFPTGLPSMTGLVVYNSFLPTRNTIWIINIAPIVSTRRPALVRWAMEVL